MKCFGGIQRTSNSCQQSVLHFFKTLFWPDMMVEKWADRDPSGGGGGGEEVGSLSGFSRLGRGGLMQYVESRGKRNDTSS